VQANVDSPDIAFGRETQGGSRRKKAENSHCHSEELATRNLKNPLLLYISFYEEIPRCARDDNSDFLRKHHFLTRW
jgi:hypothetical protein